MKSTPFFNEDLGVTIRAKEIDGEPWFVGKDVAKALGYTDAPQAIRKHVDEEDLFGCRFDTPTRGMRTSVAYGNARPF